LNADLSTANIYRDTKYQTLFHIQEKNSLKKLSFTEETLKTLVQSKHIYQFPIQKDEFLNKANNIIDILINNLNFSGKDLRENFNEIHDMMVEKDRIFLSQLIYKFPSTLITITKNEMKI
jgi:flagellin-specific chaperone FliS